MCPSFGSDVILLQPDKACTQVQRWRTHMQSADAADVRAMQAMMSVTLPLPLPLPLQLPLLPTLTRILILALLLTLTLLLPLILLEATIRNELLNCRQDWMTERRPGGVPLTLALTSALPSKLRRPEFPSSNCCLEQDAIKPSGVQMCIAGGNPNYFLLRTRCIGSVDNVNRP